MARGDHVYVRRRSLVGRYSHHGIDCGDGSVIHYAGPRASVRFVARTSLDEFAKDDEVLVRSYDRRLSPEETVGHAESRLGSAGYSLVRNNCEHFAAWCSTGRAASTQVRRWMLGSQGAVASLIAAESVGAHLLVLGTLSAGLCSMVRPMRRRRRGRRAQVLSDVMAQGA